MQASHSQWADRAQYTSFVLPADQWEVVPHGYNRPDNTLRFEFVHFSDDGQRILGGINHCWVKQELKDWFEHHGIEYFLGFMVYDADSVRLSPENVYEIIAQSSVMVGIWFTNPDAAMLFKLTFLGETT